MIERSVFEKAAEVTDKLPSALVIGSIAKAAYMGVDITTERPDGSRRDVDALRLNTRGELPTFSDDIEADFLFESWIRTDGRDIHLVFPHDESLQVEVPEAEEVFKPHEVKIHDDKFRIPLAPVLHAISRMQYLERPKDTLSHVEFQAFLNQHPELNGSVHSELLKPFNVLRTELARRKGYVAAGKLRNAYHVLIPSRSVRASLNLGERFKWLRSR